MANLFEMKWKENLSEDILDLFGKKVCFQGCREVEKIRCYKLIILYKRANQ